MYTILAPVCKLVPATLLFSLIAKARNRKLSGSLLYGLYGVAPVHGPLILVESTVKLGLDGMMGSQKIKMILFNRIS